MQRPKKFARKSNQKAKKIPKKYFDIMAPHMSQKLFERNWLAAIKMIRWLAILVSIKSI